MGDKGQSSLFGGVRPTPYQSKVDTEYKSLHTSYQNKRTRGTSAKDVLQFMVDNRHKVWWWSWEFVGQETSRGGYLSHRAPARASDLALHNPELVEDRRIGRFKVYRVRLENYEQVKAFLRA